MWRFSLTTLEDASDKREFQSLKHKRLLILERLLINCRKTKTNVITMTNEKKEKYHGVKTQSENIEANCRKRGKTHATKSWLVSVLHLIGWKSGASFLDQSERNEAKPMRSRITNDTYYWKSLYKSFRSHLNLFNFDFKYHTI